MEKKVLVIGGGLAGSEAAWTLANHGVQVHLVESKRLKKNPSQKQDTLAELVCTNSLKSKDPHSAHGMLKFEMEELGSLIIETAKECAVPAGESLSVDREIFSAKVTERIEGHEKITLHSRIAANPEEMMKEFECDHCIVAAGPLMHEELVDWICENIIEGKSDLYFYDAIAPVVDADSLDYSKLYFKDRYKESGKEADYLNAPLTKEEYEKLLHEIIHADKVTAKEFEKEIFFESCLPIDIMARRGEDTLRFSCMKPVGLELPDGKRPYAVVQLRRENLIGSAYNLVGFQNRLTYPEQKRIFRMIPGLEEANFLHLGSVHRNTFFHAKKVFDFSMASLKKPAISFAGQITGVEGYTESAASGIYVASQLLRKLNEKEPLKFPVETAIGALLRYITGADKPIPSNVNFGLFPDVQVEKKRGMKRNDYRKAKRKIIFERGREKFFEFLSVFRHLE